MEILARDDKLLNCPYELCKDNRVRSLYPGTETMDLQDEKIIR